MRTLESLALRAFLLILLLFELLFRFDLIDPRNKAYGLDYSHVEKRPEYSRDNILALCTPERMRADSLNMIRILERAQAFMASLPPMPGARPRVSRLPPPSRRHRTSA